MKREVLYSLGFLLALVWATAPVRAVDCGHKVQLFPFQSETKLFGYKDADGVVRIQPQFYNAGPFNSSGYAYADAAYIDETGKRVYQVYQFDNGPDYVADGLQRFVRDGKIGYLDECRNIAIEPVFDFAFPFHEGIAAVCEGCREEPDSVDPEHVFVVGGLWGAIDLTGQFVVPMIYEEKNFGEAITQYRQRQRPLKTGE